MIDKDKRSRAEIEWENRILCSDESCIGVIGPDGRTIDITLEAADDGWHTAHTRTELSTGDTLGVNLHSKPCGGGNGGGDDGGDDDPVLS